MTRIDSDLFRCSRGFFESDVIYIQSGKDLLKAMNMGWIKHGSRLMVDTVNVEGKGFFAGMFVELNGNSGFLTCKSICFKMEYLLQNGV
jgi:hypothetical protein